MRSSFEVKLSEHNKDSVNANNVTSTQTAQFIQEFQENHFTN